jgi:hypothetical protein
MKFKTWSLSHPMYVQDPCNSSHILVMTSDPVFIVSGKYNFKDKNLTEV